MTDRQREGLELGTQILDRHFENVGPPVEPNEERVKELLKGYDDRPIGREFYFLFDVRPNQKRIRWKSKHVFQVLGYNTLTYEQWLSIIHSDFLRIYLEFGIAAYKVSKEYKEELADRNTSYGINIPVKSGKDGRYYMMNQIASPFEFDKDRNMVSHLNSYMIIGSFDEYSPSKPMVYFDGYTQKDIDSKILKTVQEQVFTVFFPDLRNRYKKALSAYWRLYSESVEKGEDEPNSDRVAQKLNLKKATILDYNKEIIEMAKEAFPISEFTTVLSVAKFLYKLFGSNS